MAFIYYTTRWAKGPVSLSVIVAIYEVILVHKVTILLHCQDGDMAIAY